MNDNMDELKKQLETSMEMLNRIENVRATIDRDNLEELEKISTETAMLQTYVNLLYQRIYSKRVE